MTAVRSGSGAGAGLCADTRQRLGCLRPSEGALSRFANCWQVDLTSRPRWPMLREPQGQGPAAGTPFLPPSPGFFGTACVPCPVLWSDRSVSPGFVVSDCLYLDSTPLLYGVLQVSVFAQRTTPPPPHCVSCVGHLIGLRHPAPPFA